VDRLGTEKIVQPTVLSADDVDPYAGLSRGNDGAIYVTSTALYSASIARLSVFPEISFQNATGHQVAFWLLGQSDQVVSESLASIVPPSGWDVVGQADFNGDGMPDLLFENKTTGALEVWYMDGSTRLGAAALSHALPPGWNVVGLADFNYDGSPDLLLQNSTTRQLAIWYFQDTKMLYGAAVPTLPGVGWKVVGTADFNGDGHPDVLFQNSTSGQLYIFYMNGANVKLGAPVDGVVPAGWKVGALSAVSGAYQPDIVFRNGSHLMAWTLKAGKLQTSTQISAPVAAGWTLVGP
jgi:hypothetical protein